MTDPLKVRRSTPRSFFPLGPKPGKPDIRIKIADVHTALRATKKGDEPIPADADLLVIVGFANLHRVPPDVVAPFDLGDAEEPLRKGLRKLGPAIERAADRGRRYGRPGSNAPPENLVVLERIRNDLALVFGINDASLTPPKDEWRDLTRCLGLMVLAAWKTVGYEPRGISVDGPLVCVVEKLLKLMGQGTRDRQTIAKTLRG